MNFISKNMYQWRRAHSISQERVIYIKVEFIYYLCSSSFVWTVQLWWGNVAPDGRFPEMHGHSKGTLAGLPCPTCAGSSVCCHACFIRRLVVVHIVLLRSELPSSRVHYEVIVSWSVLSPHQSPVLVRGVFLISWPIEWSSGDKSRTLWSLRQDIHYWCALREWGNSAKSLFICCLSTHRGGGGNVKALLHGAINCSYNCNRIAATLSALLHTGNQYSVGCCRGRVLY